jgi:uncharacterized protein YdhG (YjbR/CyaY superfamily)
LRTSGQHQNRTRGFFTTAPAQFYFAGGKQHYPLYPATERLVAAFRDRFACHKVTRRTLRFPLSQAVPPKLIGQIAKFRGNEVAGRKKRKPAALTKRQARRRPR